MTNLRRLLRARRAARRAGAADAPGFTLPEVLIAMTVSGVLVASIATALSVVIQTAPRTEARLAESKDVTFLQTWVPVDLSTAINSYADVDDAELKNKLSSNPPYVSYLADLIGSNVLTLVVPDPDTGSNDIVAYRYTYDGGRARLTRYRIVNPGVVGLEDVSLVGVAYEIPDPPSGWTDGDPVGFAVEITARNQASLRPVGEDITVFFDSGNEFRTGGAGLSAERDLTPNDPVTLPDPTAPPTRCGGRVALVLDTSWSVPILNGGAALESAATGFLTAFTGTPTEVTILGFDQIAYQLYPNLNGARGSYFNLLSSDADLDANGTPDIDDAKNNITALPNVDTNGQTQSGSYYYGNGQAAIGWTQQRTSENGATLNWQGGTNWEDALHTPFFDQNGTLRAQTPELVVWITDGDPNTTRAAQFGTSGSTDNLQAAVTAANAGRSTGARVIGILVGPENAGREQKLADVVGSNKWTGTGPDNLGNAVAADYFASEFSQLGDVLRSIMAAECGGTVTVRKELTNGTTPATGKWNYSTETGDQVLDVSTAQSVTFDFSFESGQASRTIVIREEVVAGYSFVRGDCEVNGAAITDPSMITQSPDGAPGVELVVEPDAAVSCVMVSQ